MTGSSRIHEVVAGLTEAVSEALVRRADAARAIHIEDIQDHEPAATENTEITERGSIAALYAKEPKLHDMMPAVVRGYLHPPQSPDACIFATATACLSADLQKAITPCQYGGDPDCSQCGCMASVGFEALGAYRLGGVIPLKALFTGSLAVGGAAQRLRRRSA